MVPYDARRQSFQIPKSGPSFDPQPLNVGSGWYVCVSWSYGQIEHVRGFASEREAKAWIDTKSKDWLRVEMTQSVRGTRTHCRRQTLEIKFLS